ncbi:MAG: SsgA family sporulation/cell division regulator [Nocardioidaceae bacterium]
MTTDQAAWPFTHLVTVQMVQAGGVLAPLWTELGYDSLDPYAVTMTFITPSQTSTWTFARDLLAEGQTRPVGENDVRVSPALDAAGRRIVVVALCSDEGETLFELPADDVACFMERVHATVRPGEESSHVDVDAAIAAIRAVQTV